LVDSSIVLVHGLIFLLIGYLFSEQIDRIVNFVRQMGIWALVALVAILVIFVVLKFINGRNNNEEPEPSGPAAADQQRGQP